ncbi:MAG: leucine-rich repeat domain-containing protein [Planctomycetota bacterium]|nr:leucine-rich repeat domain-containing protein [Planctomycetota bacterium]
MTRDELLERIQKAARNQETKLDLSDEGIEELPPEIGQLTNLTKLDIGGNKLTSLPPELGQLTQLTELNLSNNLLATLPPEIGKLTQLTNLYFSEGQLTSLPPEIGQLTKLTVILGYDNKLTSLPPEIGQLTKLTVLDVERNRLTILPPWIGQLTRLETLVLGDYEPANPITTLPPEIGRLEALSDLSLDYLKLTDPPAEVVAQGTEAVLAYLREKLEQDTQIWESRLMVVGEGGVGKTQLLRALNGQDFQVDSETTHGIGVIPLPLPHPTEDGVTMTLNAWDFGGQEIYHSTHQFFLASRSLFLLCWNSRLGWEQGKLHYWLDTIEALAPGAPVMLVATHIDEREATLPFDDLKEKYPQIIDKWSVSNDERELGDGIDGIREALQNVAADKEKLPLMGETAPASFWNTTKAIRELKEDETWITAERLWEIMAENKVSEAARPVLARQLHDLGELLHFRDDEELKDTVLLDAAYVTKKISDVLEYEGIEDGLGIFTREHMTECWSGLDRQLQDHLLHLMERFDLSYEIPDDPEDRSLVVERLSLDPAPFEEQWNTMHPDAGFREIRMKFDPQSTRPAGIPGWFIARSHRFTTHTHWKYGALFRDNRKQPRHLALLESSSQYRHVQLSVRGPNPQNFFAVLRDGLELTFNRFPGLDLKRTMPCPEKLDDGSECPYEFDLAHLEKRIERTPPIATIECPECLNQVSVLRLLYGLNWTMKDRVLQRLDELDQAAEERTQQVLDEIGDLRELTQRQFLTLFNAEQRLEESHCPRVFSLRPRELETWPRLRKNLFGTQWELQLYCEAPGCWHPATKGKKKGKYRIPEPAKWQTTLAPWVKHLVTVFKYTAPLVNPVLGVASPAIAQVLVNDVELMNALVDKFPDVKADRDLKHEHFLEESGKARREGGPSLRSLRQLLLELDRNQEWGGLRKRLTPEGHWLWLCKEHAEVYRQ